MQIDLFVKGNIFSTVQNSSIITLFKNGSKLFKIVY